VLRLLELAEVPGGGAGERALLVAEEFGLDQFGGNSRAIHGDEGRGGARAAFVQGARDQFFAGAGFSEDADPRFTGGNAINLCHHPAHRCARRYNFVLSQTAFEVAVLALEAPELERIFDREEEFFSGNRFFEKIERAQACGAHRHLDMRLARHHDHRRRHSLGL